MLIGQNGMLQGTEMTSIGKSEPPIAGGISRGGAMPSGYVKISCNHSVLTLCLKRPPANALNIAFLEEIEGALDAIDATAGARAVILTGNGSVFSAGLDLKEVPRYDRLAQNRMLDLLNRVFHRLYALPLPTVAAMNGHAIAGGLILALACDRRLAVDDGAVFGLTEIRVGVPYPTGALAIIKAELAPSAARAIVLGGVNHNAHQARALGLIDELAPAQLLAERSHALARELGAIASEGYGRIKLQLRGETVSRMAEVVTNGDPLADRWLLKETAVSAAAILEKRSV